MRQRIAYEQIAPIHAPTPQQLFKLGAVGMNAAARQNKIRHLKSVERAHFFIEEMSHLNDSLHQQEEAGFIRHRMAGRIGRKVLEGAVPIWSLKFFDAYWVEHEKGQWRAERTRYRFEWDRNKTLLAERHIKFLEPGTDELVDLSDLIDRFSVADDEAVIWHTREQLEAVTREDCDLLIADAKSYYDTVLQVHDRVA